MRPRAAWRRVKSLRRNQHLQTELRIHWRPVSTVCVWRTQWPSAMLDSDWWTNTVFVFYTVRSIPARLNISAFTFLLGTFGLTHTLTHSLTHTHTQTQAHTRSQTRRHARTHTHTHTHLRSHTRTHTLTLTLTHTQTHAHTHAHANTHAHTNSLTCTHTHTHTHNTHACSPLFLELQTEASLNMISAGERGRDEKRNNRWTYADTTEAPQRIMGTRSQGQTEIRQRETRWWRTCGKWVFQSDLCLCS